MEAARFERARNMPQPNMDLKRAALPAKAGSKNEIKPRLKISGARAENSPHKTDEMLPAFDMNGYIAATEPIMKTKPTR